MEKEIKMKNLTYLRPNVRKSDSEALLEEASEDLRLVNDLAKPGAGYELTIGRSPYNERGCGIGYVEYAHYDSMGESAVKMFFDTQSGKVTIEVQGRTLVEVRKITRL